MALSTEAQTLFDELTALEKAWVDRGATVSDVMPLLAMALADVCANSDIHPNVMLETVARCYAAFMKNRCDDEIAKRDAERDEKQS